MHGGDEGEGMEELDSCSGTNDHMIIRHVFSEVVSRENCPTRSLFARCAPTSMALVRVSPLMLSVVAFAVLANAIMRRDCLQTSE
jgi:hypothetical protein